MPNPEPEPTAPIGDPSIASFPQRDSAPLAEPPNQEMASDCLPPAWVHYPAASAPSTPPTNPA